MDIEIITDKEKLQMILDKEYKGYNKFILDLNKEESFSFYPEIYFDKAYILSIESIDFEKSKIEIDGKLVKYKKSSLNMYLRAFYRDRINKYTAILVLSKW